MPFQIAPERGHTVMWGREVQYTFPHGSFGTTTSKVQIMYLVFSGNLVGSASRANTHTIERSCSCTASITMRLKSAGLSMNTWCPASGTSRNAA